jgi:hypothetical protein
MSNLQELVSLAEMITEKLDRAVRDEVNFAGIISDTLEYYAQQTRRLRNDLYQVQMYSEGEYA